MTQASQAANTQRCYQVTTADLPLSCPRPNQVLWNSHPRVFLPIETTGKSICPYCEAEYTLVDAKESAIT